MIVQPDFLTHWKTRKLINRLKDPCAPLYVIRLWALCQTSKSDCIPDNKETINAICEHDGDGRKLLKALVECGFLDLAEDGKFIVHGWSELNQKLLHNWEVGKRGGRPKKETQTKPNDNPNTKSNNPTVTDRPDRPDQMEPDGLDRKDQNQNRGGAGGGITGTVGKAIGSILKSPGGLVPVSGSGSISFQGFGYSRGEMVKHACTGSKRGDVRAKDVFEKIDVLSDYEALKICDEVNTIRMDDRKETGYLVGVFRKKLFITQGEK